MLEFIFKYRVQTLELYCAALLGYLAMGLLIVQRRRGNSPGIAALEYTGLNLFWLACVGVIVLLGRVGLVPAIAPKLSFFVVLSIAIGIGCAVEARKRRQSALSWFLLGTLFSVFAISALFVTTTESATAGRHDAE